MSCEIRLKLGGGMVATVNGDTPKEAIELAAELGELPTQCKCGSEDLYFRVRRPQEGKYTYYSIMCRSCGREFSLGETKDKRLFPKFKEGWRTYEEQMSARNETPGSRPASAGAYSGSGSDDQIPF